MIARTLGAGFLAAGVVFGMMLVGRIRALDEFKAKAARMADTQPAVVAYLDFESEDAELSDEELKIWNDFEQALTICNRKHDVVAIQVYDQRAKMMFRILRNANRIGFIPRRLLEFFTVFRKLLSS